jgi:hypothetical protein
MTSCSLGGMVELGRPGPARARGGVFKLARDGGWWGALPFLWAHPSPVLPGAGAVPPPKLGQNLTIGVEHSLGL